MVTELDVTDLEVRPSVTEEVNYNGPEAGWAIMDSGVTKTVCGTSTWNRICGAHGDAQPHGQRHHKERPYRTSGLVME